MNEVELIEVPKMQETRGRPRKNLAIEPQAALEVFKQHPEGLSSGELSRLTGTSKADCYLLIRRLLRDNLVTQVGKKRSSKYLIKE